MADIVHHSANAEENDPLGHLLSEAAMKAFRVDFIHPNETHPHHAEKLLQNLDRGAYMAVGTERGFIAAGICDRITHLELWDVNPEVVLFNTLNAALLSAAENREEYAILRFRATREEWQRASEKAEGLPALHKALLLDQRAWDWWQAKVREEPQFERFHNGPGIAAWFTDADFEDANYLHHEDQFQRVHQLARGGNISARLVDLGSKEAVEGEAQRLQHSGVSVAGVDLSNAWSYIKNDKLDAVFPVLDGVATERPLLIVTSKVTNDWKYSGFSFDGLKDKDGNFVISSHEYFSSGRGVKRQMYYDAIDGRKV